MRSKAPRFILKVASSTIAVRVILSQLMTEAGQFAVERRKDSINRANMKLGHHAYT
jgi:hypothetical protein